MSIIETRQLAKNFTFKDVLTSVDLTIERGSKRHRIFLSLSRMGWFASNGNRENQLRGEFRLAERKRSE